MNIYKVRDYLRQWFSSRGIPECPEFPAALSQGWHHPDTLLTMLDAQPASFCVFQTLAEANFCNIKPVTGSPGLIWLVKPFCENFLDRCADFFADWQKAVYQSGDEQRFVISSSGSGGGEFSERGCGFCICFNGIAVGEIRIFSAMLEERLKEPCAVLTIDVGRVLRCLSGETVAFEPDWIENHKLSRFAAFNAFVRPEFGNSRTSEFLVHEIERISKATDRTPFEKINQLIMLYNSSRGTFSECQKLRSHFRDALKSVNEALRQKSHEEKAEKKT